MSNPVDKVQEFINMHLNHISKLKVLEAGCGSYSYVDFKKDCHVVGIDISDIRLKNNTQLDEKVLGDIQNYDFPQHSFDVIICWNVLEHLERPDLALSKFYKAIKHDGIIILALPNLMSLKGIFTKMSPLWLHVMIYRYVYGIKKAGNEDYGPFKTYLRRSITPNALKMFAAHTGLQVIYSDSFDFDLRRRSKILNAPYKIINSVVRRISFGAIGDSELIMVLKKPSKNIETKN